MLFESYLTQRTSKGTVLDELAELLKNDPDLPQTNELDDLIQYLTDNPKYSDEHARDIKPLWKTYLKKAKLIHSLSDIKQRSIYFPIELDKEIESYQKRNDIQSFNQAAIYLIEKGLRSWRRKHTFKIKFF